MTRSGKVPCSFVNCMTLQWIEFGPPLQGEGILVGLFPWALPTATMAIAFQAVISAWIQPGDTLAMRRAT